MITIPAKKFEEWMYEFDFKHLKVCIDNDDDCIECPYVIKDGEEIKDCSYTLGVHLSIKSKEYMEANQ